MRQNDTIDPRKAKKLARQKYSQRQIDKWIKWSWEVKVKLNGKSLLKCKISIK